jgi:hypothetical protein
LGNKNWSFQARNSCSLVLEIEQFLMIVVKAFATTTRHCCGTRLTDGMEVAKTSIQPGKTQATLISGSASGVKVKGELHKTGDEGLEQS